MKKETNLPEKAGGEEDMAFGQFSRVSDKPGELEGNKPIVVVIDDDESMRYALQKNLEKKYTVRLCAGGEDGIRAIDEQVSVVILDIKMPGKDGFQVYDEVNVKFAELPIIFYSAYQDVLEGVALSNKYKPFSYFDKGDDVGKLLDCVDRAVTMTANVQKMRQIENRMKSVGKRS